MYSWPGVKFLLKGRPPRIHAGSPLVMISTSVPQMETASIRTSTSAGPGSGTGFSARRSWSGSSRTHAFMVFGIVKEAVLFDMIRILPWRFS